jgi:pantothenate kinase type III
MVVGLVHLLIDKYAEFYEAYPRVIATGGDAAVLFEDDELVEHIVPDLTLIGMKTAWEMSAAEQETVDLDSEAGDTR